MLRTILCFYILFIENIVFTLFFTQKVIIKIKRYLFIMHKEKKNIRNIKYDQKMLCVGWPIKFLFLNISYIFFCIPACFYVN